jgi:hypothetical protein
MSNFYDARYFCVLDGIAHTVGQYISRCAASVMESQRRLDLFRDSLWINTIRLQCTNPSVLGFLVEKAVLGYMSLGEVVARALDPPELRAQRVEVRSFKLGTEASSLTSATMLTLYIPEEFNYKAVDAVLRIVERRKEKPQVQPSRKSKRTSKEAPSKRAKVATSAAAAAAAAAAAPSGAARHGDTHPDEAEVEDETAFEHAPPTTTVTLVPLQINHHRLSQCSQARQILPLLRTACGLARRLSGRCASDDSLSLCLCRTSMRHGSGLIRCVTENESVCELATDLYLMRCSALPY